jgi:serine/threonine protein kinase
MSRSSIEKISKESIHGRMDRNLLHLLPPNFFHDPVASVLKMGGKVIKESKWRWAGILTLPNGRKIFLKRDRTKGWFESFKYIFLASRGRREWFIACRLEKKNLPVPLPLGWMEKVRRGRVEESYYISEAIGSGISLVEDSGALVRSSSINELAETLRRINDSGLFHKDLHAGNFLWDGESFFLTDLHNARIVRGLSLNQRLFNLAHLFHSLRWAWGEEERLRFIEKYFEEASVPFQKKEEMLQHVHSLMNRLQKRQWRSRTKRCLKESTGFSVRREMGIRYYHRRDFPLDSLKKILKEHLRLLKENPSALVKHSSEVAVSILGDAKRRVSVKHYRPVNFLDHFKECFRRSKGLKAWIAGNSLRVRGIPSLKPLALVEKRTWLGLEDSFFLMEASEAHQQLDRYILKGFKDLQGKRLFMKTFAQWLSYLHRMDIYHKDMKSSNILASEKEGTWDFYLLDLEDLLLNEKVDEVKLFKTFLQLNTSIPTVITWTDRLMFLKEYIALNPVIKNREIFIQRLMEESDRRGYAQFVREVI